MQSQVAAILQLKFAPVALLWSDEVPAEAVQFKEGKWGCVMWMVAGAAQGRTAACGRKTFGCCVGGAGLTDISARTYIRQQLGDHLLTLAVPFKMYQEMESHVPGSFLERPVWRKLAAGKPERA